MRFLALLLLLINVLAFAYWHMFDPPPPQQVYVSSYLPEGVEKLKRLSEVEKPDETLMVADASNTPQPASTATKELPPKSEVADTSLSTIAPKTTPKPPTVVDSIPDDTTSIAVEMPMETGVVEMGNAPPTTTPLTHVAENTRSNPKPDNNKPTSIEAPTAVLQNNPSPLPASSKNLPETVARNFARLADFRITKVKKLEENTETKTEEKTLLSAKPTRQFLSGSEDQSNVSSSTKTFTSAVLPTTQFQPVSQGTNILQVPTAIANLGLAVNQPTIAASSKSSLEKTKVATAIKPTPKNITVQLPNNSTSTQSTKAAKTATTTKNILSSPNTPVSYETLCFRTGIFNQRASAEQAQRWLQKKQVKVNLKAEVKKEKIATWLYLPAFRTRALARQAEQELARRGIKDYYLVTKAPWNNAISLGLFTQSASVTRRLAELKRKGYYNVKVQHRYKDKSRYWLDLSLPKNQQGILQSFASSLKVLKPKQINCR